MDDKVVMPGMVSLNATNYTTWKTHMENILCVKDLYEPIPSGVVAKDWEILNQKVIGKIRQFVDLSVLQHIANEHNAFKLWKKLSDMYERKNAMSKASLMRKLVKLEYKDNGSMVVHLNDFQGLIN